MYDLTNIITKLNARFCVVLDKCEKECAILRVNVNSEEDVTAFLEAFSDITKTNWIVHHNVLSPQRMVFHKAWLCHHSCKHKSIHQKTERNAGCSAAMDIKIKLNTVNTRRNDAYLARSPPLCAIVRLKNEHNHNVNTSAVLRLLRVSKETIFAFETYFTSGLSASEAISMHESKLLLTDKAYTALADSSINPTRRQVQTIHDNWRSKNLGTYMEPFEKLKEKLLEYNKQDLIVSFREEPPWCILIATGIMRRAQTLGTSREMIFCDSSASCDTRQSTITIMMAPTKAGAVPIAILIHENQTEASYTSAFSFLKSKYPTCFGGQESPMLFMTDDGTAEKNALKTVWPSSQQLLCHFHVGQAEWRWLHSNTKIPKNKQQELMLMFKKVMYATEYEELSVAVNNIQSLCEDYPEFVNRFEKFYSLSEEWTLFARKGKLTRNNNTNNFSEATVRIIKDVVLGRSKAFNVVALVDFLVVVFDEYLQKRILSYAYNRRNKSVISFHHLLKKMDGVSAERVKKIDNHLYKVPSATDKNCNYLVDTEIGICTCPFGAQGRFCKHQAFVYNCFKCSLPNMPLVSASERYNLGQLALGGKCPELSFFLGLNENIPNNDGSHISSSTSQDYNVVDLSIGSVDENFNQINMKESQISDCGEKMIEECKDSSEYDTHISSEIVRFKPLLQNLPLNLKKKLDLCMIKIHTQEQFNSFVATAVAQMSRNFKGGAAIRVQPTSIARRRNAVTKGSKRIAAGRPPTKFKCNRVKKRQRNLHKNIMANLPSAKSH
ncbi:hypothetical protein NQ315_006063, partial [Exocentrus adspersus]